MSIICSEVCQECNVCLGHTKMYEYQKHRFDRIGLSEENKICDGITNQSILVGLLDSSNQNDLTKICLQVLIFHILKHDHLNCLLSIIQYGIDLRPFNLLGSWFHAKIRSYCELEGSPESPECQNYIPNKGSIYQYLIDNQYYTESDKISYLNDIVSDKDYFCKLTNTCLVEEFNNFDLRNSGTSGTSGESKQIQELFDRLISNSITTGQQDILSSILNQGIKPSKKVLIENFMYNPEIFLSIQDYIQYICQQLDNGLGITNWFFHTILRELNDHLSIEDYYTIIDQIIEYASIPTEKIYIMLYMPEGKEKELEGLLGYQFLNRLFGGEDMVPSKQLKVSEYMINKGIQLGYLLQSSSHIWYSISTNTIIYPTYMVFYKGGKSIEHYKL